MPKDAKPGDRVRELPIRNYRHLRVAQIEDRLDQLSDEELLQIKDYEEEHKGRKTLLKSIEQKLKAA